MTREEAIRCLSVHSSTNGSGLCTDEQHYEAKQIAIQALEKEPCENAISRQAVDTLVDELARAISDERCCMSRGRSTATIMQDILDLPSVNPQVKDQWNELKETIIEMRDNNGTGTQHEVCKFLANLMDVLENQMSGSEIPNSSDCISRQAVLDKKELIELEDGQSFYCISPKDVETLPPVTPHPKTGHWINIDATHSKCDRCEAVFEIASENGEVNYCPNCGVGMVDVPDTNVGKLSEISTGSDDELYSDCIDAFKEYALARK